MKLLAPHPPRFPQEGYLARPWVVSPLLSPWTGAGDTLSVSALGRAWVGPGPEFPDDATVSWGNPL